MFITKEQFLEQAAEAGEKVYIYWLSGTKPLVMDFTVEKSTLGPYYMRRADVAWLWHNGRVRMTQTGSVRRFFPPNKETQAWESASTSQSPLS